MLILIYVTCFSCLYAQACPPGKTKLQGMTKCFDCVYSTYKETNGISMCDQCPDGLSTATPGSTTMGDCKPCQKGFAIFLSDRNLKLNGSCQAVSGHLGEDNRNDTSDGAHPRKYLPIVGVVVGPVALVFIIIIGVCIARCRKPSDYPICYSKESKVTGSTANNAMECLEHHTDATGESGQELNYTDVLGHYNEITTDNSIRKDTPYYDDASFSYSHHIHGRQTPKEANIYHHIVQDGNRLSRGLAKNVQFDFNNYDVVNSAKNVTHDGVYSHVIASF